MGTVTSFREAAERARAQARSALSKLRDERAQARQEARPRWLPAASDAAPAAPVVAPAAEPPAAPAPPPVSEAPAAAPKRKAAAGSRKHKRIAEIVRDVAGEASVEHPGEVEPPAGGAERPALDLTALGILGPGLRWRLSQLGIDSLRSLSTADAAWLRRELGEIGMLTNVEAWIEAAGRMDGNPR